MKKQIAKNETVYIGLCYRCEHRAKGHETGYGPRAECTWFDKAVWSCYSYTPVKPLILKRDKGDNRGQFAGWAISARSHATGICEDLTLKVVNYGSKGKALVWFKASKI